MLDVTRVLCRYDVKYGSSGFNPYGYKAGCGFAEFDFATALLSPTAEQYLCNPTDNVLVKCNFEHSAPGYCVADPTQNGFIQANSVRLQFFRCFLSCVTSLENLKEKTLHRSDRQVDKCACLCVGTCCISFLTWRDASVAHTEENVCSSYRNYLMAFLVLLRWRDASLERALSGSAAFNLRANYLYVHLWTALQMVK